MKILMTADTIGGVWTYAVQLARALEPHGVTIALATMGRPLSDGQRAELRALSNVRHYESGYRLEWMAEPWEDVRAASLWLRRIADEFAPDVVHLNDYGYGSLDWGRPVLVVGHSCVLSWHRAVRNAEAGPEWDEYRRRVTRGLRAADLVVAPSRGMLDSLRHHYGPLGRARVIPNGRAPRGPLPASKRDYILTAGRLWDEAKNVALLGRVAPHVAWPIRVAGEVEHPDQTGRAEFASLDLLGQIPPDGMQVFYDEAAIYALPARYEPFGLSALEAAQAGCAFVLSDIETLREIWGDAPLYASPDDPAAWVSQINRLVENPALRTDVARRCAERAGRYTEAALAAGYLDAYRQLTTRRVPPAKEPC